MVSLPPERCHNEKHHYLDWKWCFYLISNEIALVGAVKYFPTVNIHRDHNVGVEQGTKKNRHFFFPFFAVGNTNSILP